jgi:hypothetical protein
MGSEKKGGSLTKRLVIYENKNFDKNCYFCWISVPFCAIDSSRVRLPGSEKKSYVVKHMI